MGARKSFVLLLLVSIATDAWSHRHHPHHHHHHHEHHAEYRKENSHVDFVEQESNSGSEKTADSTQSELLEKNREHLEAFNNKGSVPFSPRRLEKMLEKAILKIITGDLGTAEMLLLKSLNYTPEEVLAIRERELNRQKEEDSRKITESSARKFYSDNLYADKAKHWNYNSMEFNSSPRYDPDVEDVSRKNERKRNRYKEKAAYDKDLDLDAYNRQAVIDYENLASKFEPQQSWSEPATSFDYEEEPRNSEEQESSSGNFHRSFDRAMEPHVIFKIPYDDSEFDSGSSGSDEKSKFAAGRDALGPASKGSKHRASSTLRHTTAKNVANSFHASSLSPSLSSSSSSSSASSAASAAAGHTPLPVAYQLESFKKKISVESDAYLKNQASLGTTESPEQITASTIIANVTSNTTAAAAAAAAITDFDNSTNDDNLLNLLDNASSKKVSEYEGLEWIEDDVYRVIPAYAESLGYDNAPDEGDEERASSSDYEEQHLDSLPDGSENDTLEYQNDTPDTMRLFMVNASVENASSTNLSTYQQLALAHRRDQGQKVIEDIKTRVLALTGRFNLSTNQIQRERLTMFSPTCQTPRNTDSEAWTDPFSMNMHFQLNLTSDDHVVAAKLRIYKLAQENLTTSASGGFDEDEDDEKKVRISVYYYTKSLKKHRSKKRLMDSVVTPLTTEGTHLALDVRQGLRFWRPTPRNPHGNNHGLVIQIEDQDGRPLKPASYIQQPSCVDHDSDQKAFQRTPALFVRACTRYVRIVDGEKVIYVNCRH